MIMTIELVPFEPERYFETPESQAILLSDALATGEAAYIARALGVVAKAHGMTDLARRTGLNRATLYAALGSGGNPTLDTVMKIVGALGISLVAEAKQDEAA